ncbi:MAG TPA: ribonuclease HII, partial [Flavisolibacter sp.]
MRLSLIFAPMLQNFYQDQLLEAGCDEAGRGCLAGPVFAAAVILPKDFYHPLLNDSKLLVEEERYELR